MSWKPTDHIDEQVRSWMKGKGWEVTARVPTSQVISRSTDWAPLFVKTNYPEDGVTVCSVGVARDPARCV